MSKGNSESAVLYDNWGGLEQLRYGGLPAEFSINPDTCRLKRGYLLIRVKAISVNPVDWKILSGSQKLIATRRFPRIFGTDFSGEVYRAGRGCAFSGGDAVMGMVSPLTSGSGRQWLVVRESHCMALPPGLSFGEGASLPAAGISAIQACKPLLRKPSGRVLLIGAGGGVGSLVCQILAASHWEITAVAREDQREILASRGASYFLSREGWLEKIGSGWDAIVDCPGVLIKNDPADVRCLVARARRKNIQPRIAVRRNPRALFAIHGTCCCLGIFAKGIRNSRVPCMN